MKKIKARGSVHVINQATRHKKEVREREERNERYKQKCAHDKSTRHVVKYDFEKRKADEAMPAKGRVI